MLIFKMIGWLDYFLREILMFWCMLAVAVIMLFYSLTHKKIFRAIICGIYILAALVLRILFPVAARMVFGVAGWLVLAVSTIFSRYKDRVDGKRWWRY